MKFARMLRSQKEVKTDFKKDTDSAQDCILIVKQNPVESGILKRNLENLGYLVKAVDTAQDALEELKKTSPALVISDVMLEGMNGNELCRIIKGNTKTSSIPFMFIATPESTPDKMLGFQGYGDDYITAPFDSSVLKQRVSALIRHRQKKETGAVVDDKVDASAVQTTEAKEPKLIPVEDSTTEPMEYKAKTIGIQDKADEIFKEKRKALGTRISTKFKFPPVKKINEADSNLLYSYGIQIFKLLEEADGEFGKDEYLYLLNFAERIVEKNISDNDLLALALERGGGPDLFSHCINTAIITVRIGRNLKLSKEELVFLFVSAFLSDLGLIRVPPEIFKKKGELSKSERIKVNKHVVHSIEMVENAAKEAFPEECMYISSTIYQHHEREEGQGYPNGITGDQINLSSKILGLADTYEALCHTRFHRIQQTTYRALQGVVSMKKTYFDPIVLRALVNELTFFPIGCYVRLNTDEVGLVIDTSSTHSMRPKVKVLIDSDGYEIVGDKTVNLVEAPFLYIVKPLEDEDVPELIYREE